MALPKINEHQKFELTIPSTGQEVRYRPYLVKEEKVLMLAMESKDMRKVLSAVVDTIEACVDDEIDKDKLTPYDVEYMFIMLRAKSVGEISPIGVKCGECGTSNEHNVDLESLQIIHPDGEVSNFIDVGEGMQIELYHPSYMDLTGDIEENESIESAFNSLTKCLKALHTSDNRFDLIKESREEVINLVETLTSEQLDHIKEFIKHVPKVNINIDFDCSNCGHHNSIDIEGMQSFF